MCVCSGKEELAQVHAQLEFVTAEAGGYKSECDRLREQLRGLEEAHGSQARQLEALRHEATEKVGVCHSQIILPGLLSACMLSMSESQLIKMPVCE